MKMPHKANHSLILELIRVALKMESGNPGWTRDMIPMVPFFNVLEREVKEWREEEGKWFLLFSCFPFLFH
ncbi:hypothetical protein DsansV1_C05g0053221 [Dioscorea sansibarensis]